MTWAEKNGIFFAFVLLSAFFALSDSTFYQWSNLSLILLQISVVGIIAVPQAMLILTGNVDLAVGSVMVLAAMVFGSLMKSDVPLGLAVAAAMAVAVGWGVVTGLLVAYLGLSPIVVTLGGLAGRAWTRRTDQLRPDHVRLRPDVRQTRERKVVRAQVSRVPPDHHVRDRVPGVVLHATRPTHDGRRRRPCCRPRHGCAGPQDRAHAVRLLRNGRWPGGLDRDVTGRTRRPCRSGRAWSCG